jgi:Leucine-rich repeat (LRR) protein
MMQHPLNQPFRGSTLVFLIMAASSACMFDCHDRSLTACGGVATHTNVTIFQVSAEWTVGESFLDSVNNNYESIFGNPCFTQNPLNAVNLSSRGITSIAPLGLACYNFSSVGCGYGENISEASFQAILLDGNELTSVPNMSVFSGACYVSFAHNLIGGALPSNMFAGYSPANASNGGAALAVNLQGNKINGTSSATFSGFNNYIGSYLAVNVQNNSFNLGELANGTFAGISWLIEYFAVNFESSNISGTLTSGMLDPGQEFDGIFYLNLMYNSIFKLEAGVFSGFLGFSLSVNLDHNNVGALEAGTFSFGGYMLNVSLDFNPVGSVQDAAFANISTNTVSLLVSLNNAQITTLGSIFNSLAGTSDLNCIVYLSNNQIDGESLKTALSSLTGTLAQVGLYLDHNNVTSVPGQLFSGVGTLLPGGYLTLLYVDLQYNPIASVNSSAFTARNGTYALLGNVVFILDNPCTAEPIQIDGPLEFDGVDWPYNPLSGDTEGSFTISLCNTSVNVSMAKTLGFNNPPGTLNVMLRNNRYTAIPSGAFAGTAVSSIDLSYNAITSVAQDAFTYNFNVTTLDLSNNQLGVLPTETLNTLPALRSFHISSNSIWAIQQTNTHLSSVENAFGNIIQCSAFGANTTGCACRPGYILSQNCGYWRCTLEPDGCSSGSIFNSRDCSNAPWSQCVSQNDFPAHQYYDTNAQAFLPLTDCNSAFPGVALPSYQVLSPTSTTNRICSICATCPKGFKTVPCTDGTNTRCIQELSPGETAAIVVGVLVPTFGFVIALLYIRYTTFRSELGKTKTYLELTEQLLGDERDEKEQMEQAWIIAETDLSFGPVIGEGAFGRVYTGMWGHIEVAIKVLRTPIDEQDVSMRADFDHEVKFMRSIRRCGSG